jgi:hypothetical protein
VVVAKRKWLDILSSIQETSIVQRLSMYSETIRGSIESPRRIQTKAQLEKENTPHNNINRLNLGGKNSFYLVKSVGKPEVVSRN